MLYTVGFFVSFHGFPETRRFDEEGRETAGPMTGEGDMGSPTIILVQEAPMIYLFNIMQALVV